MMITILVASTARYMCYAMLLVLNLQVVSWHRSCAAGVVFTRLNNVDTARCFGKSELGTPPRRMHLATGPLVALSNAFTSLRYFKPPNNPVIFVKHNYALS